MKVLLVALLFPVISFANTSGVWSGKGRITEPHKTTPCQEVFMKLLEDEKHFYLTSAGYSCSGLNAEYPYSVFKKVDGQLVHQGKVVGHYTDDKFFLEKPDEGFELLLKRYKDQLIFVESWFFSENDFFIVSGFLDSVD